MNYLGLDYGEKHIGVAISAGTLAQPLTTLDITSAMESIWQLVERQSVGGLVVGVPSGQIKRDVKAFIAELKSRLPIPVYEADETLSSRDAIRLLGHTTPARRKKLEHSAAAAVILQSWLDSGGSKR